MNMLNGGLDTLKRKHSEPELVESLLPNLTTAALCRRCLASTSQLRLPLPGLEKGIGNPPSSPSYEQTLRDLENGSQRGCLICYWVREDLRRWGTIEELGEEGRTLGSIRLISEWDMRTTRWMSVPPTSSIKVMVRRIDGPLGGRGHRPVVHVRIDCKPESVDTVRPVFQAQDYTGDQTSLNLV